MAEVTVFATVNPGDVVDTVEFMRKHLDDARTFLNTIPKGDYEDAYINAADIVYSLRDLDDMDKVVIIGTVASSLLVTINELSWRLADLEARTGMNSRTSSKPPSTDGYAKPNSKGVQEAQEDEDEGDLSLEDLEEEGYDGEAGEGLEEEGKDGDAGESLEEEGKDGDAGEGLEEEDEDGDAGEGLEEEDEDGDAGEGLKEEGKDGDAGEDPKEEDLKDDPNGGGEDGETDEEYRSRTNKDRSLRDLFDSEDGGTNGCGHGCVLPANATVLGSVAHWPAKCKDCPHFGECREEAFGVLTRNVLNIEVNVTVEPHVAYAILCPEEEDVLVAASFPEELKSSIQYGNYIQALVIILTCFGFVSWEKSREIIAAIMGRSFGKGCIEAFIHQLALKLTPTIELIKNALWLSKVIGADETGYRVSGKLAWVHIACNAFFTYVFISAKRGNEGMSEAGFLDFYEGILMSDCWKSYFKLDNVVNGLCNAHLLRELFGVAMFMAEDTEWASELIILLLEMNHRREQLKKEGKSEFSKEEKKEFYHRWGHIIAKGLALHPLPKDNGKKARGKVRCLLDRLVEHHKDFCLFVEDFEIPFTNNCSESGLRPVSNKSNVSYCFQSWEGARDFMIIWSYLSSCRKHDLPMMDAIIAALNGESAKFLFGDDLPERPEHVQKAMDEKAAKELEEAIKNAGNEPDDSPENPENGEEESGIHLDKLLIDHLIAIALKNGRSVIWYEGKTYTVEELQKLRAEQIEQGKAEKQARKEAAEAKRKEREEKKNKPYEERLNERKKKILEEAEKKQKKKKAKMGRTASAVIEEVKKNG